ncbi:MAG: glycosyltransferase family 2 protein, partial [Thermoanaerobaculia bacterium]
MNLSTRQTRPASVSVIIPTFQRPRALEECVQSLLDQTAPPHEILVVGRQG